MFYKHTHLLFLSLSLFSNSQILRSNKQTQSQQPCPPPHLPQFSQSQTPPSPPPITTPTPPVVRARRPRPRGLGRAGLGRVARSHWPRSCSPSGGHSVFFDFWVSDSINFYFGFCSWVFWDFGSLRKESGRRTGSGSPDT